MSSAYNTTILADSPIAYYQLAESSGLVAIDSSGNGHNGTYSNTGVTYGVTGLINGDVSTAVQLDGLSGEVTLPSAVIPSGAAPFTYECWFKATQANSGTALFQLGAATSLNGVNVYYSSVGGVLNLFDGSSHNVLGVVSDGTAYYLAVTYDGTSLLMYLNGTLKTTVVDALTLFAGFAIVGNDTFGDFFGGVVAKTAIYGTALSQARITAHYQTGIASNVLVGSPPKRRAA